MVVIDRVGLLTGAGPGPVEQGLEGIHALDGRPSQLVVAWLGGACDFNTTFTLDGTPPGYTITEQTSRAYGCRLIGVGRAIVLQLTQPIEPAIVTFVPNRS